MFRKKHFFILTAVGHAVVLLIVAVIVIQPKGVMVEVSLPYGLHEIALDVSLPMLQKSRPGRIGVDTDIVERLDDGVSVFYHFTLHHYYVPKFLRRLTRLQSYQVECSGWEWGAYLDELQPWLDALGAPDGVGRMRKEGEYSVGGIVMYWKMERTRIELLLIRHSVNGRVDMRVGVFLKDSYQRSYLKMYDEFTVWRSYKALPELLVEMGEGETTPVDENRNGVRVEL